MTSTVVPPGLGTTLQQVLDFSYTSYGFSLSATFPFHNATAKANLADALVNRTRDRYRQRQVKEQIILDVRQATTRLNWLMRRLKQPFAPAIWPTRMLTRNSRNISSAASPPSNYWMLKRD